MTSLTPALAVLLSALAAQPPARPADPRVSGGSQCFLVSQYQAWRDQDERTLYVRVNVRDIYKLTTSHACPYLTYPQARLVIGPGGSDGICTASDWDLRVSRGVGGIDSPIPCRLETMTKLTAAEAAALPRRYNPQ